jgi:hypothetical protein
MCIELLVLKSMVYNVAPQTKNETNRNMADTKTRQRPHPATVSDPITTNPKQYFRQRGHILHCTNCDDDAAAGDQVIEAGAFLFIPFFQCHHMSLMDFVVSPPDCGRSVTDFWGWDAHETKLRYPDEVDGDIWIWSTRRGLKPKFYWTTQTMVTMGIFLFKRKIPMVEPGIEPETSWSVVRNSDH